MSADAVSHIHKRTIALPFGYAAHFLWAEGEMRVEWTPEIPRLRKPRADRKFRAAYERARADFLRDIATYRSENVAVVDLDGGMSFIKPAVRH